MTQQGGGQANVGRGMIWAAFIGALALLTWLSQGYLDQRINPNQSPQSSVSGGVAEVELKRNRSGHYFVTGFINGQEVDFLLDTGATNVAVPGDLAERLGLVALATHTVSTANGNVTAYATTLDTVQVGDIRQHAVSASITPTMGGDEVLLGMSFLKDLELIQRGNTLTLRQLNTGFSQ